MVVAQGVHEVTVLNAFPLIEGAVIDIFSFKVFPNGDLEIWKKGGDLGSLFGHQAPQLLRLVAKLSMFDFEKLVNAH